METISVDAMIFLTVAWLFVGCFALVAWPISIFKFIWGGFKDTWGIVRVWSFFFIAASVVTAITLIQAGG